MAFDRPAATLCIAQGHRMAGSGRAGSHRTEEGRHRIAMIKWWPTASTRNDLGIGLPIHPARIFKHDFFVILILLKTIHPTSSAPSPARTQYRITHATTEKHIFQQFNHFYI
ncbi:hypothetical protein [Ralstonia solanacearum]|uniref:hypothetical protein n=1 Tax=Ralstonia solanacearum TaxID=305 RepID=UPI0012D478F8|nr:hypothetical protein [Ralstonia solanacearum]MDC6180222.1 hypothetical protein [Ralstonia solanacearum]MDC6212882.1 hypothetical protein [Ralstonia solanacearum]MDD7801125.1 hypothetical protein [Ralstonia solanacearum]